MIESIGYAIELPDGRQIKPRKGVDSDYWEASESERDHVLCWLTTKNPLAIGDYLRLLDSGIRILAHDPAQTYVPLIPRGKVVRNRRSKSFLPQSLLWLGLYGDEYRRVVSELPVDTQEYEIQSFSRVLARIGSSALK